MSKGKHRRKQRMDSIIEGRAGSRYARAYLWSWAASAVLRESSPGWFWCAVCALILTLMLPTMLYLAWVDACVRVSGCMALVLLMGVCFALAAGAGLVSLMTPLLRRLVRWKAGVDVPLDPGRRGAVIWLMAGLAGVALCCAVMHG